VVWGGTEWVAAIAFGSFERARILVVAGGLSPSIGERISGVHSDPGAEAACFALRGRIAEQFPPERPTAAASGPHRVDLATCRLRFFETYAAAARMFEEVLPVCGDEA
jgi:hypothetical protein